MAKSVKCDDAVDIANMDMDFLKYPKISRSDTVTICLKDCIRKIDQCGKAIYLLCGRAYPMKYGTNGVETLTKHVQSFDHVRRLKS